MRLVDTTLEGVYKIYVDIHRDLRGEYTETFNVREFNKLLVDHNLHVPNFVQQGLSVSRQHVLRGFHGSFDNNWKLTQCLQGEVYSVIVNNLKDHPQYLKWEGFLLSDKNRMQLLIQSGMGNSLLVMSKNCTYFYNQTEYYKGASSQFTLRWNDPAINAYWPIAEPILSQRDACCEFLRLPLSSASASEHCILCGIKMYHTDARGYFCGNENHNNEILLNSEIDKIRRINEKAKV